MFDMKEAQKQFFDGMEQLVKIQTEVANTNIKVWREMVEKTLQK